MLLLVSMGMTLILGRKSTELEVKGERFRREMGVDSLEQGDGAHLVEWEC